MIKLLVKLGRIRKINQVILLIIIFGCLNINSVSSAKKSLINSAYAANELIPNPEDHYNNINLHLLKSFVAQNGAIKSLTFSSDGRILMSSGGDNDGRIRFWNWKSSKNIANINRAHKSSIEAILTTPNGQSLISGSSDYNVNIWSLKTLEFNRSFVGHTGQVLALAVSPDGKILASGGVDGIRLWDLVQQRPLATLVKFNNVIYKLAISPDGKILASGDDQGKIKFWNLQTGDLIQKIDGHSQVITGLVFSKDGDRLISASRDKSIKVWNVNNGELVRNLQGHNNWINAIALHPDGKMLASAGKDGIKLWDWTTGKLKKSIYDHHDWVSAIVFSPNGQVLVSGDYDERIKVWEVK